MCRRACLRQLIAWALIAVVGVVLMMANIRYFSNFFSGPFLMGTSELDRVGNPAQSSQYFVRVTGARAIDLGLQQITVEKRGGTEVSRYVSATYYALDLGNKLLLVKSASGKPLDAEGELEIIPPDLNYQLFSAPEMEEFREVFYPFYLNTGSFRTAGYVTFSLWFIFLGLAAWKAVPIWRKLQNPSQHPVVKRVAQWGDPVQLSIEIEREFVSADVRRQDPWTLTHHYLIKTSFFGFDVLRFWGLLWAYKRASKRSVNFIPIGTGYSIVFICYG